jgi:L-ascorbate metabolism protein UlaG (beta-lactamase superfamily)
MSCQEYYLRPNVQMEPLFNQWCVWPLLIPPATACMMIANSHVKVMNSFIKAPQIHVQALKNIALRGGPFLDLTPDRVPEVKALLDRTLTEQAHMIKFAEAIKEFSQMLVIEARGLSIEPLYQSIPAPLRGYVELAYDVNHFPTARLIEPLLYKSRYYDTSLQSINLSLITSDDRPFILATPRLEGDQTVPVKIPFHHEGVDELFKMRQTPRKFGYIKEMLGLEDRYDEKFRSFLTARPPRKPPRYEGDSVRVLYLNHACLLIQTRGVSILTDPVISYDYDSEIPRYTFGDLPEVINFVLITHGHGDHLMLETLLQIRHKVETIVVPRNNGGTLEDPSLKLILQNIGFKSVIEIDDMESLSVRGGSITGIPFLGEHADLNIKSKTALLVRLGGKSILCAADSRNVSFDLYEKVHEITGDVDVLYLGMECEGAPLSWMYGPLLGKPATREMDQTRRLSGSDCEKGMHIVESFNCKQVYIYAMGMEPWLGYLTSLHYTKESRPIIESDKLVELCRRRGIISERLFGSKELFL